MRVARIVAHICSRCLVGLHAVPQKAIAAVVETIVLFGRLQLSAVGRAVLGRGRPKHNIKHVGCLLANAHLRANDG